MRKSISSPGKTSTYILPVDTLLFRKEGLRVAAVQNSEAQLLPVTPGRDFGDTIENPFRSAGQRVRHREPTGFRGE